MAELIEGSDIFTPGYLGRALGFSSISLAT